MADDPQPPVPPVRPDGPAPRPPRQPRAQRVAGRAACTLSAGRLQRLAQAGAAKAMLPRVPGGPPEVVFLNTAGGLTGGDRLDYALTVSSGTAVGTTQTAERVYRAGAGVARVAQRLQVGAGAGLLWLPQETIVFDGAALERQTEVALAADASVVMLDIVVFGRAAMGERVDRVHLRDTRRVTRDGRPVALDAVRMDAMPDGPAGLRGAGAVASLGRVGPGSADLLGPVRAALQGCAGAGQGDRGGVPPAASVRAGASAWDDRLMVRAMAADGWPLRRLIARVLPVLTSTPLPRVWQV